jgi:hypothetical protein
LADVLALTIHQPWAWAIAEGWKPVENRSWKTGHRGLVAIHAGAEIDNDAVMATPRAARALRALWARAEHARAIPADAPHLRVSRIVAVAELAGIHRFDDCSPWAMPGQWHWELANVRRLPDPIPCRGQRRLWKLPEDLETDVMSQLALAESKGR